MFCSDLISVFPLSFLLVSLILKPGFIYLLYVSSCVSNTVGALFPPPPDSSQKILETCTGFCKLKTHSEDIQREEESDKGGVAGKGGKEAFEVCSALMAKHMKVCEMQ